MEEVESKDQKTRGGNSFIKGREAGWKMEGVTRMGDRKAGLGDRLHGGGGREKAARRQSYGLFQISPARDWRATPLTEIRSILRRASSGLKVQVSATESLTPCISNRKLFRRLSE